MSEWKVTASHRSRAALIYVRQSTMVQVERNRESTARQYDLVSRAREPGWPRSAVTVTGSTAPPPAECHTPPAESSHCATTGKSPAASQATTRRKENCSP